MRVCLIVFVMSLLVLGCKAPEEKVEVEEVVIETAEPVEVEEVVAEEAEVVEVAEPVETAVEVDAHAGHAHAEKAVEVPEVGETAEVAEVPEAAAEVDKDAVLITIDGVEFTQGQVDEKIEERMKRMGGGRTITPEMKSGLMQMVVNEIVMDHIITERIKAKGIESTDAEVDAKLDELISRNRMTKEDFLKKLAENDMDIEDIKIQIRKMVGFEKLIEVESIGKVAPVTEADAQKFYDENLPRFSESEQVRASHILIQTEGLDEAGKAQAKAKIDDLLTRARAGEDFAELAKANSEDPGSKDKGGEYVFSKGRMVKEFEEAAFSLEVDKISDVVETQYGYHIIKLSEKIPAQTKSFEEVKGELITNIGMRNKDDFRRQYLDSVKEGAEIEYSAEIKEIMEAGPPSMPMRGAPPRGAPPRGAPPK